MCCEHCAATKIGCKRCCNMPNKNTFKLFLATMINRVVILFVFSFQFFRFLKFILFFGFFVFSYPFFFVFLLFVFFFNFSVCTFFYSCFSCIPTSLIFLFFDFFFDASPLIFIIFPHFFCLLRWFPCLVSLSSLCCFAFVFHFLFFLFLWSCGQFQALNRCKHWKLHAHAGLAFRMLYINTTEHDTLEFRSVAGTTQESEEQGNRLQNIM